jgi:carbamoyltransferase
MYKGFQFLGLGKTKHNSSVCILETNGNEEFECEIYLTERLSRSKNSGGWPYLALRKILPKIDISKIHIAENRDMQTPLQVEEIENIHFPFFDFLQKNKLDTFSSKFNNKIKYFTHHLAHAHAALAMSPFDKSIIVVMDGAGSSEGEFFEECSVYLQNDSKLCQASLRNVAFRRGENNPELFFGDRPGAFFEKISEYVFNDSNSAGKVMGLATFGSSRFVENIVEYQDKLNWDKKYSGGDKEHWEKSECMKDFIQLSADTQGYLETEYLNILTNLRHKFPDYENLILTGGCALNCTNNAKILESKLFKMIYVPPFPGDECVGFGIAHSLMLEKFPNNWKKRPFSFQNAYLGPILSIPTNEKIIETFDKEKFKLTYHDNIESEAAHCLNNGEIIAWFQGRSESGPRALGNRSILVRPDRLGVKNYLNNHIKFREMFRPYGSSVLHEYSQLYFECEKGFNNPFMSFAVKVKKEWQERLKEITHVDETSRMQTVEKTQNEKFYTLIKFFGELSGIYCLLNTSLNIMGEPIVETVEDAKNFMHLVPVDAMVIGNYIVRKKYEYHH